MPELPEIQGADGRCKRTNRRNSARNARLSVALSSTMQHPSRHHPAGAFRLLCSHAAGDLDGPNHKMAVNTLAEVTLAGLFLLDR